MGFGYKQKQPIDKPMLKKKQINYEYILIPCCHYLRTTLSSKNLIIKNKLAHGFIFR